jgi:hypothetical protein
MKLCLLTLDLNEEQFNHWLTELQNPKPNDVTNVDNEEVDFARITVEEKRQIQDLNKYHLV